MPRFSNFQSPFGDPARRPAADGQKSRPATGTKTIAPVRVAAALTAQEEELFRAMDARDDLFTWEAASKGDYSIQE